MCWGLRRMPRCQEIERKTLVLAILKVPNIDETTQAIASNLIWPLQLNTLASCMVFRAGVRDDTQAWVASGAV